MSEEYRPPDDVIAVGQIFAGRYRVLENIGAGAMATVYRCEDCDQQGREVALKILCPILAEDEVTIARFRNEVGFTQMLDHQNLVRVFEFGQTESRHFFITMEFIPGKSVGDFLDGTTPPFTFEEVLQILLDTASGLHFAHTSGIIHRDLKPDNILLTQEKRAKVTDFGLARSMNTDFHLTKSGEAVGTPCYMAPEQFRGEKTDVRTDIYALGIVAYELASGYRPFPGETYHAIATAHLLNPLPEIKREARKVPAWFQDFVQLCAQKDPKDRYQTMQEILKELQYRQDVANGVCGIRVSCSNIIKAGLRILGLGERSAAE